jgi:hypothetical protein
MAVNVVQSALSSRRFNKLLPWFAGGLLAIGVIVFLVVRFGNTADTKETFSNQPASRPQVTKQIPLEQGARVAVGRFILTAVARKNLDEAWNLSTPSIRGGLTHKQWMTGNIPVVPLGVPIDKAAITRIISSTKNEAQINVVVLPKPNKVGVQATLYVVIVKKVGPRWLIDYAVPQASPGAPAPS